MAGGAIIMGGGMAVSGDRGSNYPTLYLGNNQFGQCNDYTIAKGRDLSYLDVKNSSKVCVLGAATADYLFNFANPIDQIITISGHPLPGLWASIATRGTAPPVPLAQRTTSGSIR